MAPALLYLILDSIEENDMKAVMTAWVMVSAISVSASAFAAQNNTSCQAISGKMQGKQIVQNTGSSTGQKSQASTSADSVNKTPEKQQ
jgi:hypothetical protein